jgi:hypothetical protein
MHLLYHHLQLNKRMENCSHQKQQRDLMEQHFTHIGPGWCFIGDGCINRSFHPASFTQHLCEHAELHGGSAAFAVNLGAGRLVSSDALLISASPNASILSAMVSRNTALLAGLIF